jgi:long-subunit fatty acid transport protein
MRSIENEFKINHLIQKSHLFILSSVLFSSSAFSAGLEKSIMSSGHYAGIAGAASSSVAGPEALYFNPAGLAKSQTIHVTGNFSPTISQFTAPIGSNASVDSNSSFSPIGSAFASYAVTPKLGVGIGYYVSGGTKAVFENANFGSAFPSLTPTLKSDITITELSAGAGYELIEDLYIGAAYRIVFAKANLGAAAVGQFAAPPLGALTTGLLAFNLIDMSATNYNGFRLGVQYTPKQARWGVGAQFRSNIDFTANGTTNGSLAYAGTGVTNSLAGGAATTNVSFPWQLSIAGHYELEPNKWRLFLGYDFTHYNTDQSIVTAGTLTGTTNVPSITLNWNNMSNARIATEYMMMPKLALRAGYVFTSQVVPNSNAAPTFSSPGVGHTLVLGSGYRFIDNLSGDITLDYSTASGTVTAGQGPTVGDYSSKGYTAHLGLSYQL